MAVILGDNLKTVLHKLWQHFRYFFVAFRFLKFCFELVQFMI